MDSSARAVCDQWNLARVELSRAGLATSCGHWRCIGAPERHLVAAMSKADQSSSPPPAAPGEWTRLEDYLDLARLWRRAGRRHRRHLRPRTELSTPGLLSLGMLPFVLLMAAMALLTVLFMIAAVPGKSYPERPPPPPEAGTAPAGWLNG
jgi:hypothetical protein